MDKSKEKLNMPHLKRFVTAILIVALLTSCPYLTISLNPKLNPHEFDLNNSKSRSVQILETPHFEISYNEGKENYAKMVGDLAESVYIESIEFANYTPQERIPINIVESVHFDGIWLNTGGFDGIDIAFQSEWSIDWDNAHNTKQIVAHELNHLLLSRKLKSTYLQELPLWYYEGLAVYFALRYQDPDCETVNKMRLIYYNESDDFKALDEMVYRSGYDIQGYIEGCSVFTFIEQKYGIEALMLFQENVEKDCDVRQGFELTFNITQEEFETDWIDWIYSNYTKDVLSEATIFGYPITEPNDYGYSKEVPSSWHNNKILYVSDEHEDLDIYVMNDNGTGVEMLTDNYNIIDTDPKWSPDGAKILFTSNRGTNFGVYIMNADGSNVIPLVDDQYVNLAGTWSPDGESIIFITSRNGNYDLYSIGLDGSDMTQLTTDIGSDGDPAYSPDGNGIVFVSNRTGKYELYIMNKDGTEVEKLSSFQGEFQNIVSPHYSADGKRVMFELKDSWWKRQIYSMDLSNLEMEILIEPLSNNSHVNVNDPIWSGDGNEIAFASVGEIYRYEVFEISEKNIDYFFPAIAIMIIGLAIVGSVIIFKKRKPLPPPPEQESPPPED